MVWAQEEEMKKKKKKKKEQEEKRGIDLLQSKCSIPTLDTHTHTRESLRAVVGVVARIIA